MREHLGLIIVFVVVELILLRGPALAEDRGAERRGHAKLLFPVCIRALLARAMTVSSNPCLAHGGLRQIRWDRELGLVMGKWAVLSVAALAQVVIAAHLGLVELLLEK